jgi:hypothetical protein
VLLVTALVLLSIGASGDRRIPVIQGATAADAAASGLAAYTQGWYQEAVAYLTPVVMSDPSASAEADLVLAQMYEHGLGVPQDLRRAYALYSLATGASGSWSIQSLANASAIRLQQLAVDPEVVAILAYGFQDGLVMQTLPLDGGGLLEVTREGLVMYRDGDRGELPWGIWIGQVEGLSLQRALLPDGTSRQAVELIFWAGGAGSRSLMWRVYDVRGSAPERVCEEPLIEVRGFLVDLPASLPTDLRGARATAPRPAGPLRLRAAGCRLGGGLSVIS